MISIVVSSYNKLFYDNLCTNINSTIGVDYELIKVDNPGLMSISQAYNVGIKRSKFDIIIFCHEDVTFITNDWGKNIIDKFRNDSELGLIGLVGSTIKSFYPSGWFMGEFDYVKWNFVQGNYREPSFVKSFHNNIKQDEEVVCIDGFFMATLRKIIKDLKFDQDLLNDYHGYDLDISLAIGRNFKIIVTNDIIAEHMSLGNITDKWLDGIENLHFKWKHHLPLYSSEVEKKDSYDIEYVALKNFFSEHYKLKRATNKIMYKFINRELLKRLGFLNTLKFFSFQLYNLTIKKF